MTRAILPADDGVKYWRQKLQHYLPDANDVSRQPHNKGTPPNTNSHNFVAFVDSDWVKNTTKCTSMKGMILMYAVGAVGYKSKFKL